MKKSFVALTLSILFLFLSVVPAYAASDDPTLESTYFDQDGNQILEFSDGLTVTISPVEELDTTSGARAKSYTKTGSRTASATESDGSLAWKYSLIGTWTVTPGVSAVCTDAQYTKVVYNSNWSYYNCAAYTSGNQAIGQATFVKKLLGVTVVNTPVYLTITCDINGNLS